MYIEKLKFIIMDYIIRKSVIKEIDISIFSKYYDLFLSFNTCSYEQICISAFSSSIENIFIPYYFWEKSRKSSNSEHYIWNILSKKHNLIGELGILKDIENRIKKTNENMKFLSKSIIYNYIDPNKTFVLSENNSKLSILQYLLLKKEIYPLNLSDFTEKQFECLLVNYLIANIVCGSLYYKSKYINDGEKLKFILIKNAKFLEKYRKTFIEKLCFGKCKLKVPDYNSSVLIYNIMKSKRNYKIKDLMMDFYRRIQYLEQKYDNVNFYKFLLESIKQFPNNLKIEENQTVSFIF